MEVQSGKIEPQCPWEYYLNQLLLLQQCAVAHELERSEDDDCIKSYGLSSLQESLCGNLKVVTARELDETAIASTTESALRWPWLPIWTP